MHNASNYPKYFTVAIINAASGNTNISIINYKRVVSLNTILRTLVSVGNKH